MTFIAGFALGMVATVLWAVMVGYVTTRLCPVHDWHYQEEPEQMVCINCGLVKKL